MSAKQKYIVFHPVIGSYGEVVVRRWGKALKSLTLAKSKADEVRGGYVCKYGTNQIVHYGRI